MVDFEEVGVSTQRRSICFRDGIPGEYIVCMVAANATCYRHSSKDAAVGCQRCDRPICVDCMRSASVGFHCPSCTKDGAQKTVSPLRGNAGTPFTYAVLGIVVVVYLLQLLLDGELSSFSDDYVLWGPGIAINGEVWRIVTGAFLHGSTIHLLLNCYFLYNFGPFLEKGVGAVRTALIYAGGLFGGSAAVLIFDWNSATLGASGAALGLGAGAVAIMASRGQSVVNSPLSRVLLMNLAIPLLIGRISFWGHFGGIVGGGLVGCALAYLPERFGQSDRVSKIAAGAAIVAMAGISYVAGNSIPADYFLR